MHTQTLVSRIQLALAAKGLDPLDSEDVSTLSNPCADVEEVEAVFENLWRAGLDVNLR